MHGGGVCPLKRDGTPFLHGCILLTVHDVFVQGLYVILSDLCVLLELRWVRLKPSFLIEKDRDLFVYSCF